VFIVVDVQTSLINSTFSQSLVCCVSVVPLIHYDVDIIMVAFFISNRSLLTG